MGIEHALALALGALLCLLPGTWKIVRHVSTLFHEVGHAVAALLCGAGFRGIALHANSEGTTFTTHKVKGGAFSRFFTTVAGYPAPFFVAGAMWYCALNEPTWGVWIVAVAGFFCLFARSLFTLVVVGAFVLPAVLPYFILGQESYLSWLIPALAGVLSFAGMRNLSHLGKLTWRNTDEGSDAFALSAQTGLPRMFWVGVFYVLSLAMLLCGHLVAQQSHQWTLQLVGN